MNDNAGSDYEDEAISPAQHTMCWACNNDDNIPKNVIPRLPCQRIQSRILAREFFCLLCLFNVAPKRKSR